MAAVNSLYNGLLSNEEFCSLENVKKLTFCMSGGMKT